MSSHQPLFLREHVSVLSSKQPHKEVAKRFAKNLQKLVNNTRNLNAAKTLASMQNRRH
jgi:hypothetical protein